MTDPRQLMGSWSEDLAAKYLQEQGYLILNRNVRYKVGELDIVAQDEETLVFVEVRARTDPNQVHPAATVTRTKQRRVIKAAMAYCQDHDITDKVIRFDVLAVLGTDGQLEHYPNAFETYR